MIGRAILAALIVCATQAHANDPAGHASNHHFYMHLKMPGTNVSCCNDNDCRPVPHRVTPMGVQMQIAGKWLSVPKDKMLEESVPDGVTAHWCGIHEHTDAPRTYCAIIPRSGS